MIREMIEEDYKTVSEWLSKRGSQVVPEEMYPKNGAICDGLAAGWLCLTDTPVAWIDHIITNPDADVVARRQAISDLAQYFFVLARGLGFRHVLTMTRSKTMAEVAKLNGGEDFGIVQLFGKEI